MINVLISLVIGLFAGSASGVIGIGGGIIIVPALVLFFNLPQHLAQGTTLALMVPPIGLLAAWNYYKSGHVNFKIAAVICVGFIIGSFFSSKFAIKIPEETLRKSFSIILLTVSVYLFFKK